MPTPLILELRNVVKDHETGVRALNGLSLSVSAGSIFGFIGLNGAGKTTTISLLAGLSEPSSGEILLFGSPLRRGAEGQKARIGFVFDEPLYFDWMTVREYLAFAGTMYELAPDTVSTRVAELVEFFDLREKEEVAIATLSTGMKKKVSLAAAIIHHPDLILLDEPLEGVDAVASSAIKESLALMASHGTTILITSHVLDTVERFCTDVGIIHQGVLLLQCKTADIRTRAKGALPDKQYHSLEELFVDLVSDKVRHKHLSWI